MAKSENQFAKELLKLKERKGLSYKEMQNRFAVALKSSPYRLDSSLSRVMNGRRTPSRLDLLQILIWGLEVEDLEDINRILKLAEYEALNKKEIEDLADRVSTHGTAVKPRALMHDMVHWDNRDGVSRDEGLPDSNPAEILANLSSLAQKERGLYPRNPQAHRLYQKAREQWDARNPMTIKDCIRSFGAAAQRDPEYALPLLGLAEGYIMAVAHGLMPSDIALPKSKAAARRALAINPQLGQPFASLAFNSVSFDKDWHNAGLLVERALTLNPDYAFTHNALAYVSITRGNLDRAIAALDTAITLAPFSLPMRILQGDAYYLAGETKKSVEVLTRICQEVPPSVLAHVCLGLASTQAGDHKRAIAAHEIAVKLGKGNPQYVGFLGFAYAASGNIKKAKEKLDHLQGRSKRGYVPQYTFALLNIGIGEYDKALAHLEQGYTTHDHWLSFALVDPKLDPLRNSGRFKRLVSRFKLSG